MWRSFYKTFSAFKSYPFSFPQTSKFKPFWWITASSIPVFCVSTVLADSKYVYSWGSNQFGQTGHPNVSQNISLPRKVEEIEDLNIISVDTGDQHSMCLCDNGDVYSFGRAQFGRLGHGLANDPLESTPRLIEALQGKIIVKVSGGHYGSAAITKDGQLYTWGKKWEGQLGHKGPGDTPLLVEFPYEIVDVSCGRDHTICISSNGELFGMGNNRQGALGLGNINSVIEPTLIEVLDENGKKEKIVSVSTGYQFSIILTSSGKCYSFGSDDYGSTGQGGSASRYIKKPKLIGSLQHKKIIKISSGEFHSAALTEDGHVYTWGFGEDGQNGHGSKAKCPTPRLVHSLEKIKIVQIACGGGHTSALDDKGVLYIWGRGNSGQLGRGDKLESVAAYRPTPRKVEYFIENHLKVDQVALGGDHTIVRVHNN